MALTNFPNGVSSFGVPVVGNGVFPTPNTNGNVWFVNSVKGSDGYPGTWDQPFATLSNACSQTNLLAGDTIVVMEGHTETVTAAAGILLATAGVNVMGISQMTIGAPTITFTTATTATMKITGAYCNIIGLRFVNGFASQVTMLDIQAKGIVIMQNQFVEGAATTGLSFIDLVGTSANVADGLKILNNYFYNPTAGNYNHAIGLNSVQDNVEIAGNYGIGNFALSGIHNVTGVVATRLNLHDNYVRNLTTAKPASQLVSAVTGVAYRNTFEAGDYTTSGFKPGTALDVSGNNVSNGGNLNAGEEFWLVKKGIAWTSVTTGGIALTAASIGGELAIEELLIKTSNGTLTTATLINVQTNNTMGVAVFWSAGIALLAANMTANMSTASMTLANGRTVLESGKVISIASTGANAAGTGTFDVYIKFARLTAGADISLV